MPSGNWPLPSSAIGSSILGLVRRSKGRRLKACALAASIEPASRKLRVVGERKQWYFTCTLRIPDVSHKVRILILWERQEDQHPRIFLVSNRIQWEASRIVRAYRHRWTGT